MTLTAVGGNQSLPALKSVGEGRGTLVVGGECVGAVVVVAQREVEEERCARIALAVRGDVVAIFGAGALNQLSVVADFGAAGVKPPASTLSLGVFGRGGTASTSRSGLTFSTPQPVSTFCSGEEELAPQRDSTGFFSSMVGVSSTTTTGIGSSTICVHPDPALELAVKDIEGDSVQPFEAGVDGTTGDEEAVDVQPLSTGFSSCVNAGCPHPTASCFDTFLPLSTLA